MEEHRQIVRATWRCKKVREQFVLLSIEGALICSPKRNPSILRKTSKEDIVNFSLTELDNQLKDKQVVLHLENVRHLASHRRQTPGLQNLLSLPEANYSL